MLGWMRGRALVAALGIGPLSGLSCAGPGLYLGPESCAVERSGSADFELLVRGFCAELVGRREEARARYEEVRIGYPGTPSALRAAIRVESLAQDSESADVASLHNPVVVLRYGQKFPAGIRERGIEGWIRVSFTIGADGTAQDPLVAASEPRFVFELAAMEALSKWRFEAGGTADAGLRYGLVLFFCVSETCNESLDQRFSDVDLPKMKICEFYAPCVRYLEAMQKEVFQLWRVDPNSRIGQAKLVFLIDDRGVLLSVEKLSGPDRLAEGCRRALEQVQPFGPLGPQLRFIERVQLVATCDVRESFR